MGVEPKNVTGQRSPQTSTIIGLETSPFTCTDVTQESQWMLKSRL